MKSIKFLREPGFMYDLFYIFSLYYNFDVHVEEDIPKHCKEEGIESLNNIIDLFLPISDELEIFFHKKDNGKEFISEYCFHECIDRFTTDYDFRYVIDRVTDTNKLTIGLLSYYFPDIDRNELIEKKDSMADMSVIIDNSDHPEVIKRKLYSFLSNPSYIIRLLYQNFMEKNVILTEYYEKNYTKLLDVYDILKPDQAKTLPPLLHGL